MALDPEKMQLLRQMMMQYGGMSSEPSALAAELNRPSMPNEQTSYRPSSWGEPRPIEPQPGSLARLSGRYTPQEPMSSIEPEPEAKAELTRTKAEPIYGGGKAFVEGLMKRGWTREEAAAAAGNAHVESGFRPGVKSSAPNEKSFGFLQWNSARLQGLQNMAEATGRNWTDPETQLDWINMERTGESTKYGGTNESGMYTKALAGGGTPGELAERFGRFVERPLSLADTVEQRRRAAAQYAREVA